MNKEWQDAQQWEKEWHGNCVNSLGEELKQLVYAEKMLLQFTPTNKTPYSIDLQGNSVLDIGGGAYSLLLKATNFSRAVVCDPLMSDYPEWVIQRYGSHGIIYDDIPGEKIATDAVFDEVWIYNVLEHTYNPQKIIENALQVSKIIRIFEWIETRKNIGHPQTLTAQGLDEWLDGHGIVSKVSRNGAVGKCYSGVFVGKHYE